MTDVAANLEKVRVDIAAACRRAGRDPADVRLIAVSKTHPVEAIEVAYRAGQRDFGENYAQELRDKAGKLPQDIRWHFIGHLQTNKIKYVVGTAALIHSVDSAEIIESIAARARRSGLVQDILVEINLSGEASKTGAAPAALGELASKARSLEGVRFQGLMTMAAEGASPEGARQTFNQLKTLAKSLNLPGQMPPELSMGMSGDFESAVLEGATLVRIGTAIFGPREGI